MYAQRKNVDFYVQKAASNKPCKLFLDSVAKSFFVHTANFTKKSGVLPETLNFAGRLFSSAHPVKVYRRKRQAADLVLADACSCLDNSLLKTMHLSTQISPLFLRRSKPIIQLSHCFISVSQRAFLLTLYRPQLFLCMNCPPCTYGREKRSTTADLNICSVI